jgi:hypothetical protein
MFWVGRDIICAASTEMPKPLGVTAASCVTACVCIIIMERHRQLEHIKKNKSSFSYATNYTSAQVPHSTQKVKTGYDEK